MFKDIDVKCTAERKLINLQQRELAVSYTAEFFEDNFSCQLRRCIAYYIVLLRAKRQC